MFRKWYKHIGFSSQSFLERVSVSLLPPLLMGGHPLPLLPLLRPLCGMVLESFKLDMIDLACGVIRISIKCSCLEIFDQQGNPNIIPLVVDFLSYHLVLELQAQDQIYVSFAFFFFNLIFIYFHVFRF